MYPRRNRSNLAVAALLALLGANLASAAAIVAPWPTTRLKGDAPGDRFGHAIALDGDFLVIGAPGYGSTGSSTGSGRGPGIAYVYHRSGGSWLLMAKLQPSPLAGVFAEFGSSVAFDRDTVAVGCPGDLTLSSPGSSGAVYVFERNAGGPDAWGQVALLEPTPPELSSNFGAAVGLFETTLVVGDPRNDDPVYEGGAVWVHDRNEGGSGTWGLVRKLHAPGLGQRDWFGQSVAVDKDVVVGGQFRPLFPALQDPGSFYAFDRNQGGPDNWDMIDRYKADGGSDRNGFGMSIATTLEGELVVVGAPYERLRGPSKGAAYVFRRQLTGGWEPVQTLQASDAGSNDRFGLAVAATTNGDILVGSPSHNDSGPFSGSAYLFTQVSPDQWQEVIEFVAADTGRWDKFGASTAIDVDGTMAVGAPYAGGGPGFFPYGTGAVYIFE